MSQANQISTSILTSRAVTLPSRQVMILLMLIVVCSTLIFATIEQSSFTAVLLLIFVSIAGLILCRRVQIRLHDPSLRVLGYFWLVKLGLTLFLLYAGWIPQLDPQTSTSWGYDPQRYYMDAYDLIENNWVPVLGSNYQGIIYFYGVIFYILGHNPVIPALINAFVTLLGTLFLIRVAYEFKEQRSSRDWTLAFALLIPEVIWFDVMTSRETLTMVLVMVAVLAAGRYIVRSSRVSFTRSVLLTSSCLLALLVVRTSIAIPVVVSIFMIALLLRSRRGINTLPILILVVIAAVLLSSGPMIQTLTGGYNVDYLKDLSRTASFLENVASGDADWTEKSIGLLLAPDTYWQNIIYTPPRMILYIISPLPNITVSVSDLFSGSWKAWQHFFMIFSSLLNIIALPYALAGFAHAFKRRKYQRAPLVMHITYWLTFISIAGGNIIIHERYRLIATLLFAGCVWLGVTSCTKQQVSRFSTYWYSILASGAIFYLVYKTL